MRLQFNWYLAKLLLLGIGLSAVFGTAGLLTTDFFSCGDCPRYLDIAASPFHFTASPWGYRIFVPYAARLLSTLAPISIDGAFLALTAVGFVGVNGVLVAWWAGARKQPLSHALLLSALYCFSFGSIFYLHGYQNIGFWEHLAILLGFVAIAEGRWIWLFPVLIVGETIKESVIVLIPLYLFMSLRRERAMVAFRNTALLMAAYVAMFAFLRSGLMWRDGGNVQDYVSYYTPAYFEWLFSVYGGPLRAIPKTLAIFPVTLPLAIIGYFFASTRDRVLSIMAPLALSQLAFGGDVERLMILAFPGILLLVGVLLRFMSRKEQVGALLLSVAAFYAHYYLVFSPRLFDPATGVFSDRYASYVRGVLLICYLAVGGWYWFVLRPRTAGLRRPLGTPRRSVQPVPDTSGSAGR